MNREPIKVHTIDSFDDADLVELHGRTYPVVGAKLKKFREEVGELRIDNNDAGNEMSDVPIQQRDEPLRRLAHEAWQPRLQFDLLQYVLVHVVDDRDPSQFEDRAGEEQLGVVNVNDVGAEPERRLRGRAPECPFPTSSAGLPAPAALPSTGGGRGAR